MYDVYVIVAAADRGVPAGKPGGILQLGNTRAAVGGWCLRWIQRANDQRHQQNTSPAGAQLRITCVRLSTY